MMPELKGTIFAELLGQRCRIATASVAIYAKSAVIAISQQSHIFHAVNRSSAWTRHTRRCDSYNTPPWYGYT